MLNILQNIWKFISGAFTFLFNIITFEFRLLDLSTGVPATMTNLLFWLPASCLSVIIGIIAIQILIKVFSKGQG